MHADQRRAPHVFILWAQPPLMVRPMSTHEGIEVYTPTVTPYFFYYENISFLLIKYCFSTLQYLLVSNPDKIFYYKG